MNLMPSEALLAILVCPETHQPLRPVEEATLQALNRQIAESGLSNRGGALVKQALESGLVREDGKYLYPVVAGIPVMLIEEAIGLP